MFRSSLPFFCALLLAACAGPPPRQSGFQPVYEMLEAHCGTCHVQGAADGPWSLNTPPAQDRYSTCLDEAKAVQLSCATWHQLVDPPAPGIPAWIRPEEAPLSEPYIQACDPSVSFHIGHSLPAKLTDVECIALLGWIKRGALFDG